MLRSSRRHPTACRLLQRDCSVCLADVVYGSERYVAVMTASEATKARLSAGKLRTGRPADMPQWPLLQLGSEAAADARAHVQSVIKAGGEEGARGAHHCRLR